MAALGERGWRHDLASATGVREVAVNTTTDGTAVDVPPEQARSLHLAEGGRPAGLGELGVGGWVTEPTETDGPTVDGVATREVTGPVDGADVMSDLAVLTGQVSGEDELPRLEVTLEIRAPGQPVPPVSLP